MLMWILMPYRGGGKSRLAGVMTPAERERLGLVMLRDMLATLCRGYDGAISVVTSDAAAAASARAAGCHVERDAGDGMNTALNRCARGLAEKNIGTLLVLPADLPAIRRTDIEAFMRAHRGGVSVARAIADGGTNALLCTPPGIIGFQFGADSAERHRRAAVEAGTSATVADIAGLRRDIDRPGDLCWLLDNEPATMTAEYIRRGGLEVRLRGYHGGTGS